MTSDDILGDLLANVTACPLDRQIATLEELCSAHPKLAEQLRRRFKLYRELEVLAPDDQPHRASDQVGDYTLLRQLGQGGMGVVYLAQQRRGDQERLVALKLIRDRGAFSAKARERFLREGSATFQLEHPALCQVYDIGEVDGSPYIAMRYVEGETLAQHIYRAREYTRELIIPTAEPQSETNTDSHSSRANDSTDAILACIETLALGLHSAHEAGLVHRDVKPGNIMVAINGAPVLLDFGLVRDASQDALTMTGQPIGTPAYMSPEQIDPQGRVIDRTSDIYSLGATLYEALCLRQPFEAETREELFRKILTEQQADIRQAKRQLPRDLQIVIQTAMAKEPSHRYATALAFAEDLRRVRKLKPIAARQPSLYRRLALWGRRNRLASTALVFLAISQSGMLFFAIRAEHEAESARKSQEQAMTYFGSAREAVQELTRTASNHLEGVPWLEPVRRELFEKALIFYRGLLDTSPDDADLNLLAGSARRQAASLYLRLGELETAEAWFKESVDTLTGLDREQNAKHRELARAYAGWGQVAHRRGKFETATQRLERAISLWREAPPQSQASPGRNAALANALRRLARVQKSQGKDSAERILLEQAMQVLDADRIELRVERAATSLRLGIVHYEQREFVKAAEAFATANSDLRTRLETHPRERSTRSLLASCLRAEGRSERDQGRLEAAFGFLNEARTLERYLVTAFPEVPTYQLNLAITLESLSNVCRRKKQDAAAEKHLLQAIDLLEPLAATRPDLKEALRCLASAHYNVGNMLRRKRQQDFDDHYRRCLDILDPLIKTTKHDVESLDIASRAARNLAIGHAIRGEHEAAATQFRRSRAWLEQLVILRPDHHRTQVELAIQLYNEGSHLAELGRIAEAETLINRCVENRKVIVQRSPHDGRRSAELLKSQVRLGQIIEHLEPERALKTWREAQASFDGFPAKVRATLLRDQGAGFDKLCLDRGLGTAVLRAGELDPAKSILARTHSDMAAFIDTEKAPIAIFEWVLTCTGLSTIHAQQEDASDAALRGREALNGIERLSTENLHGLVRQRIRTSLPGIRQQLESLDLPSDAIDTLHETVSR